MLNPPVSMLGIPAMRKLSKEILSWKDDKCFDYLVTYATIPPHLPETFENSNGMRFWKAEVLNELGGKYKIKNWIEAAELFKKTGKFIIDICESAMIMDKEAISDLITKVADIEAEAYKLIKT